MEWIWLYRSHEDVDRLTVMTALRRSGGHRNFSKTMARYWDFLGGTAETSKFKKGQEIGVMDDAVNARLTVSPTRCHFVGDQPRKPQ